MPCARDAREFIEDGLTLHAHCAACIAAAEVCDAVKRYVRPLFKRRRSSLNVNEIVVLTVANQE